jgi:Leucine-rich repeat (LRR) protein
MSVKRSLLLVVILLSGNALAADFAVDDAQLQKCITKLAMQNQWKTAEDVVEISCHNQNIRSLNGIEQFVNVARLSFHRNMINSVKLDRLTRLTHLNLSRNNLTELHIADFPELAEVYVFRNNLRTLTLSNLPKLANINANTNKLVEFTYSNLPLLEKIYIFNNTLETVDIHKLPALKYMDTRQNPMPDALYDEMNALRGVTILHDGNAEDW